MRIRAAGLSAIFLLAPVCAAQLTPEQRLFDFQHLASVYIKHYAPYEWKRDLLGVDLYRLDAWFNRIRASRSDLEYLEIAAEFVASLQDSHSSFSIPSNFRAGIGISVDIYDGKVLIDNISRATVPESKYPFGIGDEILSIDGRPVADVITDISRFVVMANPRGTRRISASFLFNRLQSVIPRAHEVGEDAVIVVKRASGDIETYSIPWTKRGTPITQLSPGPGPFTVSAALDKAESEEPSPEPDAEPVAPKPPYRLLLEALQTKKAIHPSRLLGWGQRTPTFALPEGFTQRLGRSAADFHYSGSYTAGDKRIGFLRIPNFSPASATTAARELRNEVAWLEANTDGLVIDITRNTGGGCYGEDALRLLIPYPFRAVADEIRATQGIVLQFESAVESAKAFGAEEWEIALLQSFRDNLKRAQSESRGRTGPIPTCGVTSDLDGEPGAYTKPILLLTDEFTVSWGDAFAAAMADAGRAKQFGYRTDGAGGLVSGSNAGFYSDTVTSFSLSLGTRKNEVKVDGYPSTAYIENVGVHPDIEYDAMTRENLMTRGKPFVEAFTAAILAQIEKGR